MRENCLQCFGYVQRSPKNTPVQLLKVWKFEKFRREKVRLKLTWMIGLKNDTYNWILLKYMIIKTK